MGVVLCGYYCWSTILRYNIPNCSSSLLTAKIKINTTQHHNDDTTMMQSNDNPASAGAKPNDLGTVLAEAAGKEAPAPPVAENTGTESLGSGPTGGTEGGADRRRAFTQSWSTYGNLTGSLNGGDLGTGGTGGTGGGGLPVQLEGALDWFAQRLPQAKQQGAGAGCAGASGAGATAGTSAPSDQPSKT